MLAIALTGENEDAVLPADEVILPLFADVAVEAAGRFTAPKDGPAFVLAA